jgi:hypothetical protein
MLSCEMTSAMKNLDISRHLNITKLGKNAHKGIQGSLREKSKFLRLTCFSQHPHARLFACPGMPRAPIFSLGVTVCLRSNSHQFHLHQHLNTCGPSLRHLYSHNKVQVPRKTS